MRPITFICAYFRNPGMLREQQRIWNSHPEDIRRHFHAIVVDDCSPEEPALPHVEPVDIASYRLYRAREKKRWNWLFGRNLGVHQATTDWVLLTDIDHVAPAGTLRTLMDSKGIRPESVYRFSRVDAPDLTPYKMHPNSWFLTREMFDRIGGYDERFSGYYGSDAEFRERVEANASQVVILSEPLIRYPREYIPDASTRPEHYGRKEPQDREGVGRVKVERAKIKNWRPLRLTIPWDLQYDSRTVGAQR